jgi:hypothetical protein
MTVLRLAAALTTVLVLTSRPFAADLAKIERRIAREPAYQSESPLYGLMVFGPQAKQRVWLVLDGDCLYVDRNANGDLTEEGERLSVETPRQDPAAFEETELTWNGESHKFRFHLYGWFKYRKGDVEQAQASLDVWWNDDQRFGAWGDEESRLKFSTRPAEAPIVHIGGPLQMGFEVQSPFRKVGDKKFELNAAVGTKGLGPGTFAHLIYNVIPDDVFPQATLEFPSADPQEPAIKVDMAIKDRC